MTEKQNTPVPRILDYAPNTAMILGALLSGGDPLKMAEMLVEAGSTLEESETSEDDDA